MTMADYQSVQGEINSAHSRLLEDASRRILSGGRITVIKAPAGSGKTYTLVKLLTGPLANGQRIAIAGQTRTQCDDIANRIYEHHPEIPVFRFASKNSQAPKDLPEGVKWVTRQEDLPAAACVVVGTTQKWSLANYSPFHFLFIDEAWQLPWASFMLLDRVAERFVMIGDPGQIDPVTTVDTSRWTGVDWPPHVAAPQNVLANGIPGPDGTFEITSCRRLPAESVELIQPFYELGKPIQAWAPPGSRWLRSKIKHADALGEALERAGEMTHSIMDLATPTGWNSGGPDRELAERIAVCVRRLLHDGYETRSSDREEPEALLAEDIGIAASTRVMTSEIMLAVRKELGKEAVDIRVDTFDRWQGLERKVMLAVHPLSSQPRPSAFDLNTGRLCVLASRHQSALIVFSRDHVPKTLENHLLDPMQPPAGLDGEGQGLDRHIAFWDALRGNIQG